MKIRSHKQDSLAIVYDADRIDQPGAELFDPAHWAGRGAVVGEAAGRGSALFLDTGFGPAVLRQYLRGGWPARISRDRYVFLGYRRSRPVAEFEVLAELAGAGLPVPAPIAAMCRRRGLFCRGWLLMERIMDVAPLADFLDDKEQDETLWRHCGETLRRFHSAGVVHADLNARNILVSHERAVYLVDFDRARIREADEHGFRCNLARLRRSLEKLWPPSTAGRLDTCWGWLLAGYGAEAGGA